MEPKSQKEVYLLESFVEIQTLSKNLTELMNEVTMRVGMTQDLIEGQLTHALEVTNEHLTHARAVMDENRTVLQQDQRVVKESIETFIRNELKSSLKDAHNDLWAYREGLAKQHRNQWIGAIVGAFVLGAVCSVAAVFLFF